ncbi:unnamed protein product [Dibothriocephalus latus]|uniref:Reverse transcriptase domain-containing protein n=1 Tax=Dibothriocephalus latus TaxID=60516 RepID=A0A3P6TSD5_DIBLA|nr:unnamed protein product [Dibothriocephalus latus]
MAFNQLQPAFWCRYVDDTFVTTERNRLADFQNLLDGIFTHIQFPRQEENTTTETQAIVLGPHGITSGTHVETIWETSSARPQPIPNAIPYPFPHFLAVVLHNEPMLAVLSDDGLLYETESSG